MRFDVFRPTKEGGKQRRIRDMTPKSRRITLREENGGGIQWLRYSYPIQKTNNLKIKTTTT